MLYKISIENVEPNQAIDLKNQLLDDGLVVDVDFTWRFRPSTWDYMTSSGDPAGVDYHFKNATIATFYQLKWSKITKHG